MVKDPVPKSLKARVAYKFICTGCNSEYTGETSWHFSTRVREHLFGDRNSHVYKHLQSSHNCKNIVDEGAFVIIDSSNNNYQLRLKEGMHIEWQKPKLNKQLTHTNLTIVF